MHVAIIYADNPPNSLLKVLSQIEGLTLKLLPYETAQSDLMTLHWDALFFDSTQTESFSKLLAALRNKQGVVPAFSYSKAPPLENSGVFLAHIDEDVTKRELEIHLQYALKLKDDPTIMRSSSIFSACREFHQSLDQSRIAETALEVFSRLFPGTHFSLFVNSEQDEEVLEQIIDSAFSGKNLKLRINDESLLSRSARDGKVAIMRVDAMKTPDPRYIGQHSVYCFPLLTQGSLRGVVEILTGSDSPELSAEEVELAFQMVASLALALANAKAYADVERLCNIDDLTQLYNSRYLYQVLEAEMKRARRYKIPLSIVFIDLDGFKQVNDTNGHLCGSATLTEIAKLMMGLVRETDIVARYGGDEFVIVLPETHAENAAMIAERIRSRIETHVFRGGGDMEIYLTASFGVASYPEHASTPAALIRCADKAMYTAKGHNKNRVILAK